ncbi:MAG: hypothetical protein NVSMB62_16910 [Acidobacteriaceae bacterium]
MKTEDVLLGVFRPIWAVVSLVVLESTMPSRKPTRTTRRILQLASLGLAGLLAGLLAGCSGVSSRLSVSPNDTDWQTSSTYASATSNMSPRAAVRSTRVHMCDGAVCAPPLTAERVVRPNHRTM